MAESDAPRSGANPFSGAGAARSTSAFSRAAVWQRRFRAWNAALLRRSLAKALPRRSLSKALLRRSLAKALPRRDRKKVARWNITEMYMAELDAALLRRE